MQDHIPLRLFKLCAAAALLALTSTSAVIAQQISVIVPALRGNTSRPAHFNWSFESAGGGDVRIGQFACGSYWIAPAEGDSSIKLLSLTGNPAWTDYLSVDDDPRTERHGLLDGSNNYGSHDPSENLLANLPATVSPDPGSAVSLVAAMQRNEAETGGGGTKAIVGEVVDAYCVITVMAEPPANGGSDMIRPNITGTAKEFLTWDDFELSRLRAYDFMSGNNSSDWENARIRWSHSVEIFGGFGVELNPGEFSGFSEGGRAFRAHILHHDYAAGMTSSYNNDVMALLAPGDLEGRKPALAAMLAFANDLYHARYDYGDGPRRAFTSGAGQHAGKFLPMVLLAALQKDEAKGHELRKVAINVHHEDPGLRGPQELRQIKRGATGIHLWGDGRPVVRDGNNVAEPDRRYWSGIRNSRCFDSALGDCTPNIGQKTAADPYGYHDGPTNQPGSAYFGIGTGATRALAATMILIPEVRSIVNTDAPIEYSDRLVRHGLWTAPDPIAAPSEIDQLNSCDAWRYGRDCVEYGVTWGPDPLDVRFGIEDGVGRFVSMHGQDAPVSRSYEARRALDNWDKIIAYYDGLTYEDTFVPLGMVVAPDIYFETGDAPRLHMRTATLDAEIRYTLDGSEPTASSTLYEGPVPVELGATVRASAYAAGLVESPIAERTFTLTVEDPQPEPPAAPTGLVASNISESSFRLDWTPVGGSPAIDYYTIYIDEVAALNSTHYAVNLTSLTPGTDYSVTVTSVDVFGGESTHSDPIVVTTLAGQRTSWAGFPVQDGIHVDTQELIGWIILHGDSGWVWSWTAGSWLFLTEDAVQQHGAWVYFVR